MVVKINGHIMRSYRGGERQKTGISNAILMPYHCFIIIVLADLALSIVLPAMKSFLVLSFLTSASAKNPLYGGFEDVPIPLAQPFP